jgi:hypothetical protein
MRWQFLAKVSDRGYTLPISAVPPNHPFSFLSTFMPDQGRYGLNLKVERSIERSVVNHLRHIAWERRVVLRIHYDPAFCRSELL